MQALSTAFLVLSVVLSLSSNQYIHAARIRIGRQQTGTGNGTADSTVTVAATGTSAPGSGLTVVSVNSASGGTVSSNGYSTETNISTGGNSNTYGDANATGTGGNLTATANITDASTGNHEASIITLKMTRSKRQPEVRDSEAGSTANSTGTGTASSTVTGTGSATSVNGGALNLSLGSSTSVDANNLQYNPETGAYESVSGVVSSDSNASVDGSGDLLGVSESHDNTAQGGGTSYLLVVEGSGSGDGGTEPIVDDRSGDGSVEVY